MKNIGKNFLLIALLSCTLCGCTVLPNKQGATILFSSKPIGKNSLLEAHLQKAFKKGEKIFFAVYSKEGFGSGDVRIQILKKNDKTPVYGYSIEHARDIEIDHNKNYFRDCVHIYNKGHYYFRVFIREKPYRPIGETFFWIE